MKKITVLLFIVSFIISCSKEKLNPTKNPTITFGFEYLKKNMNATDFEKYDWSTVVISRLRNEDYLLTIKDKNNSSNVLYFAVANNQIYQSLVEYKIMDRLNNSGKLIIKTVDGKIKNEISFLKGKAMLNKSLKNVQSLSTILNSVSTEDPYVNLPEITITSYIYADQATNWWSLFWLFNLDNYWYDVYTIDANLLNQTYGGPTVTNIDDLYPESSEILIFEQDFKKEMSPEEIQIFDNMSRFDQLMYLWNAFRAKNLAATLYQFSLHNGKGDAFRHAYFSALNAKSLGVIKAQKLGNAHETTSNEILETKMDLNNNAIGRSLYLNLSNYDMSSNQFGESLKITLIKMINNGQLWHLTPLDAFSQVIPNVTKLVPTNQ